MSDAAAAGRVVVDASVAIKWHVVEGLGPVARRLLDNGGPELHAPDLFFAEAGNILWKKARRGDLTEEEARQIAHLLAVAPIEAHPTPPLLEAALEIAIGSGRTVYDSLYVALAVQLDCPLVTADERLVNALAGGPLGRHVRWLGDDQGSGGGAEAEDFEIPNFTPPYTADEIEVIHSFLTGDRITDDGLALLRGLGHLRELYLNNPAITDVGLAHVAGLAGLRTLYAGGTAITDDGLRHLRSLAGLRTLNLAETAVTDGGLVHLTALTGLRTLSLRETRVTDGGLVHLHDLTGLIELDLTATAVTEAGVGALRRAVPDVEVVR